MDCRFYVGQRVVCVDATETNIDGTPEIEEGRIYTIAGLELATWVMLSRVPPGPTKVGDVVVHLAEVPHRFPGFRHTRFRPATDISSLEALLNATRTPERETA